MANAYIAIELIHVGLAQAHPNYQPFCFYEEKVWKLLAQCRNTAAKFANLFTKCVFIPYFIMHFCSKNIVSCTIK